MNETGRTFRKISGSGELQDLVRSHPWDATPLGPISDWSETLVDTVNMVLNAPVSMQLLWGPEMVVLYNEAFSHQIGPKHPSVLGQKARDCWGDAWEAVGDQLDAALYRGVSTRSEAVPIPLNLRGFVETVYWDYSYSPIFDAEGNIVGILDICQNVTENVKAAEELTRSKAGLEAAERAIHDTELRLTFALRSAKGVGTWDWDVVNNCVYADRAFAEAYGVDPQRAAAGCPIGEFLHGIHADDREQVSREITQAMRTGEEYIAEYRLCPHNGQERWITARGRCLLSAEGTPLRFPGVTIDTSERKATEQALLRNEKLAAVGRLASSIAHEINNPLESVTNLLYLIRGQAHGEQLDYVDLAERELHRVSAITNQTLRFHKQATNPTIVTCEDLIASALSIYQSRLFDGKIAVERRKRSKAPVFCLEGEIRQVLSNLIGNAIDALPSQGGRLLLRSRDATDWKTGRRGLVISVADTGAGMPREVVTKVFDAFYTTKGIGGTGLGLWISKEIIERHQGTLRFRTSQKAFRHGTVFTIFLPFEDERTVPLQPKAVETSL